MRTWPRAMVAMPSLPHPVRCRDRTIQFAIRSLTNRFSSLGHAGNRNTAGGRLGRCIRVHPQRSSQTHHLRPATPCLAACSRPCCLLALNNAAKTSALSNPLMSIVSLMVTSMVKFARRPVFVSRLVVANSFVSRNSICVIRKPGYRWRYAANRQTFDA